MTSRTREANAGEKEVFQQLAVGGGRGGKGQPTSQQQPSFQGGKHRGKVTYLDQTDLRRERTSKRYARGIEWGHATRAEGKRISLRKAMRKGEQHMPSKGWLETAKRERGNRGSDES